MNLQNENIALNYSNTENYTTFTLYVNESWYDLNFKDQDYWESFLEIFELFSIKTDTFHIFETYLDLINEYSDIMMTNDEIQYNKEYIYFEVKFDKNKITQKF